MQHAIVTTDVRKSYGDVHALRGVDFEVRQGEVFSLLGPNGAGKTTLVEILEGYRRRSGGDVQVLGEDPERATGAWRARIGIVLQDTAVFDWLTVEEVVTHFASFYPAPRRVGEVIDAVQLAEKRSARCASLSGGQKRRVDLALGLIGDPELIFLDEPTTGLDPEARRQLWAVIEELAASGTTIVLTTHYLDEAEALANRVGIILNGAIADVGRPAEIGGRDRAAVTVRFLNRIAAPLPELPGSIDSRDGVVTILTDAPTATVGRLAAWAEGQGEPELPGLTITRPSLEDTYLAMVRAAGEQA